jgi:hypothetical protein
MARTHKNLREVRSKGSSEGRVGVVEVAEGASKLTMAPPDSRRMTAAAATSVQSLI